MTLLKSEENFTKTTNKYESPGETENKEMEKSERNGETEDNSSPR